MDRTTRLHTLWAYLRAADDLVGSALGANGTLPADVLVNPEHLADIQDGLNDLANEVAALLGLPHLEY